MSIILWHKGPEQPQSEMIWFTPNISRRQSEGLRKYTDLIYFDKVIKKQIKISNIVSYDMDER